MDRSLSALIRGASSSSTEEQARAVFQVAMLLEKNTRPSDENGFYETVLPSDVLGLDLDEDAQAEILGELVKIPYSPDVASSVFWAIGKSSPRVGAPILLRLFDEHPEMLDDHHSAYQAMIALENCLDHDRDEGKDAARQVEKTFRNPSVARFLRHASSSSEEKLAEVASRLLRRLKR